MKHALHLLVLCALAFPLVVIGAAVIIAGAALTIPFCAMSGIKILISWKRAA